ncbi:hypothetical protein H4O09_02240 [Stenotrophomonas sp. W1S232]|uniref:Uncharacterized protein n=1 Tax=Stenotrophomonas koreensis TaxID=266128 RepID=A0A7W3UY53_9GAMM|nr:hypothetical protein [Stenotrophomonas koreensis]MBB1115886.1 hypothetical protein [Stenotrophomonas koreensis]
MNNFLSLGGCYLTMDVRGFQGGRNKKKAGKANAVGLAYLFEAGKGFRTLCVRVTFDAAKVTKTKTGVRVHFHAPGPFSL